MCLMHFKKRPNQKGNRASSHTQVTATEASEEAAQSPVRHYGGLSGTVSLC